MSKADYENAKNLYPSCGMNEADWIEAFNRNSDIMWAIVGDIYDAVKTEQEKDAGLRRMGRRPARHGSSMDEVYATVFPPRYTMDPFPLALEKLVDGRSQRQFAMRVPCDQGTLCRLLSGQAQPNLELMERIAVVAKVPAHYFVEYRALLIGNMVTRQLMEQPNIGITAIKRLRAAGVGSGA